MKQPACCLHENSSGNSLTACKQRLQKGMNLAPSGRLPANRTAYVACGQQQLYRYKARFMRQHVPSAELSETLGTIQTNAMSSVQKKLMSIVIIMLHLRHTAAATCATHGRAVMVCEQNSGNGLTAERTRTVQSGRPPAKRTAYAAYGQQQLCS